MSERTSSRYEELYPKTVASQISDVYSKSETSNLFLPKSGGSMGGILDMSGNKITNLANPTESLDSANKKYVDEKVGTWNTLFENEGTWNSTRKDTDHRNCLYVSNALDMAPLSQAKECKLILQFFGSITFSTSHVGSIGFWAGGFPARVECNLYCPGNGISNVDGFEIVKVFNNRSRYDFSPTSYKMFFGEYSKTGQGDVIYSNQFFKNQERIELFFGFNPGSGGEKFQFSNLHYKLKMEYKN